MLAALVVGAVAAPASASSFSTAPRVKERTVSVSRLMAVRAGRHAGFDRVVFELRGTPPGYRIQYVPKVVQDGSGVPVALTGKAFIQVVLSPTSAHLDSGGQPAVTVQPAGTGSTPAGELPFTGLPLLAVLGGGVSLLGVGLALIAAERRRRSLLTGP
jgi:hypothetical protein